MATDVSVTRRGTCSGVATEDDALIRFKSRVGSIGGRPRSPSWTDVVLAAAILSLAAALVVYSWTLKSRRDTQAVDWTIASAYPFSALRVRAYDTADVIATVRAGRWFRGSRDDAFRSRLEARPDSWLADPTDLTVFGWEDGVFTMNTVRATSEELGLNVNATPPAVSEEMLRLWRTHDYDALQKIDVGGFAHDRVYVAFLALVYTAMAYMPTRFTPGQPPFHVVTHQRDYLALRCTRDVPKGSKFNPCPAADAYAPILNFGAGFKSSAVFPTAVAMPHPEFIDAVLKNMPSRGAAAAAEPAVPAPHLGDENAAPNEPLGLDEDHLDEVMHAREELTRWEDRVSVVHWRGHDVPFVPGMPFGAERGLGGNACRALLTETFKMSDTDAEDAAVLAARSARVTGVVSPAFLPRNLTTADVAAWMASKKGQAAARGMTPRWRAVLMAAVARNLRTAALGRDGASPPARRTRRSGRAAAKLGDGVVEATNEWEEVSGQRPSPPVLAGAWLDARFTDVTDDACAALLPREEILGDRKTFAQRQRYKYALDVGGQGGTSWMGTLTAMSTASLVFRVDSPMADFYDAELKPWVHYVPVAADLSDLSSRYQWAQANQAQARQIAAAGALFARDMSAERMWAAYASLPLGEARKAYHPAGPAAAGLTEAYRASTRELVPLFTYDATKETGDKHHTGVMLLDGEKVRETKGKRVRK